MAETITMPKMGFDMAEGTLVRWVKTRGETVNKGEVLAEIETDKATVEVESPFSGIVYQYLVDQGTVVPVGTPIAIITEPGETPVDSTLVSKSPKIIEQESISKDSKVSESPTGATITTGSEALVEGSSDGGRKMASPLAKRIAREEGLDLASIQGSGPEGRVVRKDVEAYVANRGVEFSATIPTQKGVQVPQPNVPEILKEGDIVKPIDKLRATIGRRMTESKQQIPHIYLTREFKMEALMELRKQLNSYLPEDQKLTINDFVVKATAMALKKFPTLNSSFSGNQIIQHGQINIGVAVAVKGGLMTVVCRNADQKTVHDISFELREKANRARLKKVHSEDIEGSTFTISNLGMYHVENFQAIINPPEVAILAVGAAQQIPVVENGELRPGLRMKVTLSSDHRVTDGAESADYLQVLGQYLEEPLRMVVY